MPTPQLGDVKGHFDLSFLLLVLILEVPNPLHKQRGFV